MENNIHKGTELNNVKETWQQNERNKESNESADMPAASELDRVVRKEATEYDEANKEERVLGGDRASVRDDEESV